MILSDSIRILHISDVHLDSPFAGLDLRTGDIRRTEQRAALLSSLELAKDEACQLILIAGDLFDCGYVTEATVREVFSAIEKTSVPVVLTPGNHDPYTPDGIYSRNNLPKNLHIFKKEELERIDLDELKVSVHGYAFLSNRYTHDPLERGYSLKEGYINILCAHTELDEAIPRFAPIKRSELEVSGFDYAALGHVHAHTPPVTAGGTTYSYGGFLFGRSFDELGFGRGLIVDIDRESRRASVRSVRLADKRYEIAELDIGGSKTAGDISASIMKFIASKGFGAETALRVRLRGAIHPEIKLPTLIGDDVGLALLQLRDETTPFFDEAYLENDITLKGALYRRLRPNLRSDDERTRKVAAEALRIGLCALDGKSFI